MNIAIDTNILVNAFRRHEPVHRDVASLVSQNRAKLCHDTERRIHAEYEQNLSSLDSYRKWYNRVAELQALYFCSGNLEARHRTRLRSMGCHEPSDHVFVAVASRADKILVSEDSDFGKGPNGGIPPHCHALRYLTDELRIRVFDAVEACDYFNNSSES